MQPSAPPPPTLQPPSYEQATVVGWKPDAGYAQSAPPPVQPYQPVMSSQPYHAGGMPPPVFSQPMPGIPPTQVVVVSQPAPTPFIIGVFGPTPTTTTCPHCRQMVTSRLEYDSGLLAWVICFLLFFFGFWLCCLIPFCCDDCKDVTHRCPVCHNTLGIYKRIN